MNGERHSTLASVGKWIRDNVWLLSALGGIIVFIGLLLPLVSAKPVTAVFESDYWSFSHGKEHHQ